MTWLLVRRSASGLVALLAVTIMTFSVIHGIPGDPIGVQLAQYPDPVAREALERFYGLDRSLPEQYIGWLSNITRADFGTSMVSGGDVLERLLERFPRSLYLMAGGLAVSLVISLPAGIWASLHKGRGQDLAVTAGALALQSIPSFWLGTLLVLIFGVRFRLLPTAGYTDPSQGFVEFVEHAVLPMVAVGAALAGITTRTVRAAMVGELQEDYVALARSVGVPFRRRIVPVHMLRNASIPIVTLIGLQVGLVLSGTVIIEQVFAYPGLGLLLINAVLERDYPVIQGAVLLFAAVFILMNMAVDIAVTLLDPKAARAMRQHG